MNEDTTILIVDDEPIGREALAMLLYAYNLTFASTGAGALVQAAEHPPDLILLDVMLPGMDGFEVCRRIRANPALAEVPVIMVTALDDRDSRLAGIDAGADEFITKPFDRLELRTRVRTITRLNRYRKLLAERTRLARIVEFAPDAMLIIEQNGTIALANPAAIGLLGAHSADDLAGRVFLELVVPERRIACADQLARLTHSMDARAQFETVLSAAKGHRTPVELHIGALLWDNTPAIQLIARDISDRKRAELLEEERRQIAYELHDGLAQVITGAHQYLQTFAAHHRPRSAAARADLARAIELVQQSVRETRRVIAGLRPIALDDFGLANALRMSVEMLHAEGWQIEYKENLGTERLAPEVETVLFRVIQEALANIRKHAQTQQAQIIINRTQYQIDLIVQDWGIGFDPANILEVRRPGEHIGLYGMRERITLLGGTWELHSHPGQGARIHAEIPLPPPGARDAEA